jgi:hypothetical protein
LDLSAAAAYSDGMTVEDVCDLLRRACDKAGGIREWARQHDVSAAYVSDVLLSRRAPGPSICGPLGLEAVRKVTVTYRRIRK